jgi:hypothetical protein
LLISLFTNANIAKQSILTINLNIEVEPYRREGAETKEKSDKKRRRRRRDKAKQQDLESNYQQ